MHRNPTNPHHRLPSAHPAPPRPTQAVNIEDDFFNYIKSDHATTHRFDELRAALNDKSSESCMWSPSDAAVAATRRLVGGSAPPTDPVAPAPTNTTVAPQETLSTAAVSSDYRLAELQIMYIKPEFGDVLDAHSVSRMREIETQLMADPLYVTVPLLLLLHYDYDYDSYSYSAY